MNLRGKLNIIRKQLKVAANDENGSAEIIGLVLILLFVVLAVSGKIKDLGSTMKGGIGNLDTEMKGALTDSGVKQP